MEGYAMREDRVARLRQPGTFSEDPLTEILRVGARRLLAQAVEMEVTAFVEGHADLADEAGRRRIVRHGYLPEREIQTGIGPVAVRCPRVRDRGVGETGSRVRFTSAILPRYLGRAKSIEELLPWLYLKGISTGDFSEALGALLGSEAPGLSASTIARHKEVWQGELEHWQRPEFNIRGLRRADVKPFVPLSDSALLRQLHRLRVLGLIKRVSRSHRYYLTGLGRAAIAAACSLTQFQIAPAMALAR